MYAVTVLLVSLSNWTLVNPAAFSGRASAVSAFFPKHGGGGGADNGFWLVMGGYTYGNFSWATLDEAWMSTDLGQTWQPKQQKLPFKRSEMAGDVLTTDQGVTTLLVCGGVDFGANYTSYNDVWTSSNNGDSFQLVTASAPWAPRMAHGVVTQISAGTTSKIVLIGGYNYNNHTVTYFNDIWFTTNLGATWTQAPLPPFSPRGDHGVVINNSTQIIVVGGYGYGTMSSWTYNDVWRSSADLSSWTLMTPHAPFSSRWGFILESFNGTVVLIGGSHNYYYHLNDIWISWNDGANFTKIGTADMGGRTDAVAEIVGPNMYIAGGEDNNWSNYHMNGEIWSTVIDYTIAPEPPSPPTPDPPPPTPTPTGNVPYSNWTLVNGAAWTSARASSISAFFPANGPMNPARWCVFSGYTFFNGSHRLVDDAQISDDFGVTWQKAGNTLPFKRLEMAADLITTSTGTTLLVTGGVGTNPDGSQWNWGSFNDVWQSVDRGASFQLVTANAPWSGERTLQHTGCGEPRAAHEVITLTVGVTTPTLVILGGYNLTSYYYANYFNDVWYSTDLGVTWAQAATPGWSGRGDFGSAVNDRGQLFIMGGANQGQLNDVWMTDSTLKVWTQINPAAAWMARSSHIVESFNNTLVVIGGLSYYEWPFANKNDVWVSWDNGANWTFVVNATFGGRSDAIAEIIGSSIYVGGGWDNNHTSQHVNNEVWSAVIDYNPPVEPPTPPAPVGGSSTGGATGGGTTTPSSGLSPGALAAIIIVVLVVVGVGGFFLYRYLSQPVQQRQPKDSDYHLQV